MRLLSLLMSAGMCAGAGSALAETHVLVVSGLGGEPQYDERFSEWSEQVAKASVSAAGSEQNVVRLSGQAAQRDAVRRNLEKAATLGDGDQFVLVLIGHGSYDGNEYRLNIPGPDLTGTELMALLDRIPAAVPQLVVNTTSTSGAISERWSRPHRVVVTATRSGGERNATRFAAYWAEALASDTADRDKDGSVTAQEAYDFAVRKVEDAFKADASIVTEHARITGNDPARFVVARLGSAALFANDAQLIALRQQQTGIERQLLQLKPLKAELPPDDYYNRIEPVLLEMARLGEKIDARLTALGAAPGGGS